jgi:hypothetical protein
MISPHIRPIAENDALRLHAGDPLPNGAARQSDLASQGFKRKPGVLLKKMQDLKILLVHVFRAQSRFEGAERLINRLIGLYNISRSPEECFN